MKSYTPKPRTFQQNNALHLFCQQLANTLNDAGWDMRKTLKPSISIPWTKESVKEYIWRPIQEAMFQKKSTTELYKLEEIDKIHEVIMRELGEKFGIEYIKFPNQEDNEVVMKHEPSYSTR